MNNILYLNNKRICMFANLINIYNKIKKYAFKFL